MHMLIAEMYRFKVVPSIYRPIIEERKRKSDI